MHTQKFKCHTEKQLASPSPTTTTTTLTAIQNSLYTHTHTHRSAVSHLDDSVVDGGVLLLPQHHQGDDDHSCYDDASNHQADDGALVGAHILGEEDLREVRDRQWSGDPSVARTQPITGSVVILAR